MSHLILAPTGTMKLRNNLYERVHRELAETIRAERHSQTGVRQTDAKVAPPLQLETNGRTAWVKK
jgi:hypothetical protein